MAVPVGVLHDTEESSRLQHTEDVSNCSSDGKIYSIGMLPEDIVNSLAQKFDLVCLGRVGLVAKGWNKKIWGFQRELIFTRDKRNPLVEQLRLAACPAFTGWPRPPPTALVGPGSSVSGNFDPRRITDYLRIRGLAGVEGIFEDNNIEAIVTAALSNNLRFLKQLRYLEASAYVPRGVIEDIRAKYPPNQLAIVERLQITPVITPGAPPRVTAAGSMSARSKLLPMLKLNLDGEGRRAALQLAHEVDHDELALALFDVARRPRSKLLSPLLDVYASLYSARRIHMLRNADGVNLLMLAVQSGAEYNFNAVLKSVSDAIGVDATRNWLDEGDVWGNTALHYACTISSGPMVATLLAAGADSNTRNVSGEKPIHMAQSRAVMKLLLDPQEATTIPTLAIPTILTAPLSQSMGSSSSASVSTNTPEATAVSLSQSQSGGSPESQKRSHSPGKGRNAKKINQVRPKVKITIIESRDIDAPYSGALLHRVCTMGEDGHFLLQYLLPHIEERHVWSRDPFGFTALHLAASAVGRNSVSPILHTLLKHVQENEIPVDLDLRVGFNISHTCKPLWKRELSSQCDGMTALHLAASNYGTANMESLLNAGANADCPLPEGSKWGNHSIDLVWMRLDSFYDKSIDYEMINAKVCQVATLLMERSERAPEFAYKYDWKPQHKCANPSPQLNMERVLLSILRKINPSNERLSTMAIDRLLTVICQPLPTDPVANASPSAMSSLRLSSPEIGARVLCAVIEQIPPCVEREDIIEKLLYLEVSPSLEIDTANLYSSQAPSSARDTYYDDFDPTVIMETPIDFAKRLGDKKAAKQLKRFLAESKEIDLASPSSSPPESRSQRSADKCIVM